MSDDDRIQSGDRNLEIARLKQVMGRFATGITVITALDEGEPVGFTAQTFTSLSLDPPLVMFCPQRSSTTWPRIQRTRTFCVNILGEDQEALCRTFAAQGTDRFDGMAWRSAPRTRSPILGG